MGLFGTNKRIDGQIGCFQLEDWWLETFSESERDYIEATYQPMGSAQEVSVLGSGVRAEL